MNSNTVALRDQLLAIIRGEGCPISTDGIAAMLPPHVDERIPCTPFRHAPYYQPGANEFIVENTCLGETHRVARRVYGAEIYRHLRALEAKGLCARLKLGGSNRVYWTGIGGRDDDVLTQLEHIWSTS